jgi:cell division protein FtsQ
LIDAGGTLMELAPGGKHRYSFAVIAGMSAGEPLSTRAARMKNYNELVRELDSGGAHYSQELSEVDLSDSEDVKVLAADANGEVLVHLGSGNYLQRYKTYVTHVQQWRQQFEKLESVDLRYDGQIIVNPDLDGMARQPALTPAAAKVAMAAGVKTAAIVNYEKYVTHPVAAAPAKKDAKPKAKAATKAGLHRASAKPVPAKPAPAKPAPVRQVPVKQAPVKQAALKTKVNEAPVAATKNTAVSHLAAPSPTAPPTPVAVTTGQKKPSAGIPKETPQN